MEIVIDFTLRVAVAGEVVHRHHGVRGLAAHLGGVVAHILRGHVESHRAHSPRRHVRRWHTS